MSSINEWLGLPEFVNARFTSVFRKQLEDLTVAREINFFGVLDEIKALEGVGRRPSTTKPSSPFKGGPLHGLMHKHFMTARHIPHNLQNYWRDEKKVAKAIRKVATDADPADDPRRLSSAIAHRIVWEAFNHKTKARSFTGDWLIYKRCRGRNYYLCLAVHGDVDDEIFARFAQCAENEFPELGIRANP